MGFEVLSHIDAAERSPLTYSNPPPPSTQKGTQPMPNWLPLKSGDTVEIIAPAGRGSPEIFATIKELLNSWHLNCQIHADTFGDDLLCANSDNQRFAHLQAALINPDIAAIWCLRGGYGSARLIPFLEQMTPPRAPKPLIGFSDITALHTFFQKQWGWPTIHGPSTTQAVNQTIAPDSLELLHQLLMGEIQELNYADIIPLNRAAKKTRVIHSSLTGGNLAIVQTSMGTAWQIDARNKIVLLEEVNEVAYRVDRMLNHLTQANIFEQADAIIFGNFKGNLQHEGYQSIPQVLANFANKMSIPVLHCNHFGHDVFNHPMLLGTEANLWLGDHCRLTCTTNRIAHD